MVDYLIDYEIFGFLNDYRMADLDADKRAIVNDCHDYMRIIEGEYGPRYTKFTEDRLKVEFRKFKEQKELDIDLFWGKGWARYEDC